MCAIGRGREVVTAHSESVCACQHNLHDIVLARAADLDAEVQKEKTLQLNDGHNSHEITTQWKRPNVTCWTCTLTLIPFVTPRDTRCIPTTGYTCDWYVKRICTTGFRQGRNQSTPSDKAAHRRVGHSVLYNLQTWFLCVWERAGHRTGLYALVDGYGMRKQRLRVSPSDVFPFVNLIRTN